MIRLKITLILHASILILLSSIDLLAHPSPSKTKMDDPSTCDVTVQVNMNAHICEPGDFDLQGIILGDYDEFTWCENGTDTGYDLDETVEIEQATMFTLKASYTNDVSIIVNGDFESGDSDFTTDYTPGQGNCSHPAGFLGCEGVYNVIDDPSLGHTNFDPCSDNGGGGNMMVVNGAAALQEIWCQTVCVSPDASYVFNAYAASVNPGSPAILQFAIDGTLIGDIFGLTGTTCAWEYFEAEWFANGETSIEICVTNQNTAAGGNDFALDDISFSPLCSTIDSLVISINAGTTINIGPDTTSCFGQSVLLDATTPSANYSWQDGSINPTFNVSQEGIYWVLVTANNCIASDTISVNYTPLITIDIGSDTTLCQGETLTIDATISHATYLWQDNSTYPIFNVSEQGIYWVEVTLNNCKTNSDSIIIYTENCGCPLYIPNSFTPNFDNKNDEFLPIFDCDVTEYNFQIFNRWGELIFESNTPNNAWDGNYKGKISPVGVYVYSLKYNYEGNYQKKYGHVNLVE